MAKVTLGGNPFNTVGELPAVGAQAPDFVLTTTDLADVTLGDFAGKRIILNVFPSLDTPVLGFKVQGTASEENSLTYSHQSDAPFLTIGLVFEKLHALAPFRLQQPGNSLQFAQPLIVKQKQWTP